MLFDFSYSPIKIEDGSIGGILVTVIETTEKKIVADALQESNARFMNNIMQAPVAMCIFKGENHIVEIANEQMLQLWGTKAENVINKPIFEALPGLKKQGFDEILHHVFTNGKKLQQMNFCPIKQKWANRKYLYQFCLRSFKRN